MDRQKGMMPILYVIKCTTVTTERLSAEKRLDPFS